MPFSSLADPAQVARAQAALERAWIEIQNRGNIVLGSEDAERQRLAAYISGYAMMTSDDDEVVARALERFLVTKS